MINNVQYLISRYAMQAYREDPPLHLGHHSHIAFSNNTPCSKPMVSPHWHDACELLLIRRGWGRQQLNAAFLPFHAGDLVCIRPGDVHASDATAPDGCDIDVVQFLPGALGHFASEMDAFPSRVISSVGSDIIHLFDLLMANAHLENAACRDMTSCGLLLQLVATLKYHTNAGICLPVSPEISRIRAWLDSTADLNLSRTAQRFGYCPEHLSRKFHAEVGIPFRQYCDQLRMRRAIGFLQEGVSITETAERLGYSDPGSFIRAFRSLYALTPGAYIRLCKSNSPDPILPAGFPVR